MARPQPGGSLAVGRAAVADAARVPEAGDESQDLSRRRDRLRATRQAQRWMDAPAAWTPVPGPRHRLLLAELIEVSRPTPKRVSDLRLAALALENGLAVVSV